LMLETRFTFGQSGKVTLDERSWIAEVDDAIPVVRVESGWLVRRFYGQFLRWVAVSIPTKIEQRIATSIGS